MVTVLGIGAAAWGILMAVAPVLQIRRMWQRRSSRDVSIPYFAVLVPGFLLWIGYGVVRSDWALIVPNTVAVVVSGTAIGVAVYLRNPRRQRAAPG